MQTFTMAEIVTMISGRICLEPNGTKQTRSKNEMLQMCSKFGGPYSSPDIAVANAVMHVPAEIQRIIKEKVTAENIAAICAVLIEEYGSTIDLPIEDSGTGIFVP